MKQNKFFPAAIALLLIAFFTTSWVSATPVPKPKPVLITVPFSLTGGTFPTFVYTGPFTISGAFKASGTAIMVATVNADFTAYDCMWTLTDDNGGTFTLHEVCQAATMPFTGRWEILSGTGHYTNLRGNGSALMPDKGDGFAWEVLTGVIYVQDRRRHTEDQNRNCEDQEHDE
jgi:Protein of unknown function (DUF3224)